VPSVNLKATANSSISTFAIAPSDFRHVTSHPRCGMMSILAYETSKNLVWLKYDPLDGAALSPRSDARPSELTVCCECHH
jgi:hypothetical protein